MRDEIVELGFFSPRFLLQKVGFGQTNQQNEIKHVVDKWSAEECME